MCARDGCGCDAGGLDALEGRLWAVVEPDWCPCGERAVGEGLLKCVMCAADEPAP